jgi:hypothetical protein
MMYLFKPTLMWLSGSPRQYFNSSSRDHERQQLAYNRRLVENGRLLGNSVPFRQGASLLWRGAPGDFSAVLANKDFMTEWPTENFREFSREFLAGHFNVHLLPPTVFRHRTLNWWRVGHLPQNFSTVRGSQVHHDSTSIHPLVTTNDNN